MAPNRRRGPEQETLPEWPNPELGWSATGWRPILGAGVSVVASTWWWPILGRGQNPILGRGQYSVLASTWSWPVLGPGQCSFVTNTRSWPVLGCDKCSVLAGFGLWPNLGRIQICVERSGARGALLRLPPPSSFRHPAPLRTGGRACTRRRFPCQAHFKARHPPALLDSPAHSPVTSPSPQPLSCPLHWPHHRRPPSGWLFQRVA